MANPRVLLISPGQPFATGGNFGDAHLVALGSYVKTHAGADVTLHDVDYEQRLPHPQPARIYDGEWDVVGISCFSSFEYLKSLAIASEIRRRHPASCIVAGGYHPSARPADFLGEESPFDHVVVGEGERGLLQIVQAVARGTRVAGRVLGPDTMEDLDELPLHDWSLLDRYRPYARDIATQFTLSLSRGCPFHCAFCMEGAKDASWRAYSPARGELEVKRVAEHFDLRAWTMYFTDPLFGIRRDWRREMLERLQRLAIPVDKFWALTRADIIGDDDIRAFHSAGFGLGFGLESGDVGMLGVIHKGGRPDRYLQCFVDISELALEIGFPWGANVIAGHPGETADTLQRSAAWIAGLFRRQPLTTGFILIDPFRFYPGSPIDRDLAHYEEAYGTRIHRKRWWNYTEPGFTSSWVDPSRELDFLTREHMQVEVFSPIVDEIARKWAYNGPAPEYFTRSIVQQQRLFSEPSRLATLAHHALWRRLTGVAPDEDAREYSLARMLSRSRRTCSLVEVIDRVGPLSTAILDAIVDEPRERYAPEQALPVASEDIALPLVEDGRATLSALHAYARAYSLLDLKEGDCIVELGGGTGYGAALASRIVGDRGRIRTVEIEATLAERAKALLADRNVEVIAREGRVDDVIGFSKVVFSYALDAVPDGWLQALPDGGRLLAPIRSAPGAQQLTLWIRCGDAVEKTLCGRVQFVRDRARSSSGPARS